MGHTIPGRLRDVGLGKLGATYSAGRISYQPTDGPEAPYVDLTMLSGKEMDNGDFGSIQVSTARLSVPRKVTEIPVTSKTYAEAAHEYLVRRGLGNKPFHITRIVKADLDGDGTDEVLIEGLSFPKLWLEGIYSFDNPRPAVGQFAAVLLRYVGEDKKPRMRALFLERCARTGVAEVERLSAIADLDGDGVMEVVNSGRYYEGEWATIYRCRKGKVKTLAQMGSGA